MFKKIALSAVSVIVCFIIAMIFIGSASDNLLKYNEEVGIYNEISFDFVVPSPTTAQVSGELTELSSVDSVAAFYKKETSFMATDGETFTTSALYLDDVDSVESTMFCESRALSKGSSLDDNSILIDSVMADDLSVKVGDKVTATIGQISVEYEVYGIYSTNTYYTDCNAMAIYNTTIINQNPDWSLQGAFITSSNEASTWTDLADYIPYGRMLSSDDFASPSTYESYYNNFISSSYVNEIEQVSELKTYAESLYGTLSQEASSSLLSAAGLIFILMIMLNLVFVGFIFMQIKSKYSSGDSRSMMKKAMAIGVLEGLVNIAIICLVCAISSLGTAMIGSSIFIIIGISLAIVINFVVLHYVDKKAFNSADMKNRKREQVKTLKVDGKISNQKSEQSVNPNMFGRASNQNVEQTKKPDICVEKNAFEIYKKVMQNGTYIVWQADARVETYQVYSENNRLNVEIFCTQDGNRCYIIYDGLNRNRSISIRAYLAGGFNEYIESNHIQGDVSGQSTKPNMFGRASNQNVEQTKKPDVCVRKNAFKISKQVMQNGTYIVWQADSRVETYQVYSENNRLNVEIFCAQDGKRYIGYDGLNRNRSISIRAYLAGGFNGYIESNHIQGDVSGRNY